MRTQDEEPSVHAAYCNDPRMREVRVVAPRTALERSVVVLRIDIEEQPLGDCRDLPDVVHAQTGRVVGSIRDTTFCVDVVVDRCSGVLEHIGHSGVVEVTYI